MLDEVGRGTATWDGLAIAWAVLEALHDRLRCRTIFATHFHELAALAGKLPELAPATMRVREQSGSVVFLHAVAPARPSGPGALHVARLAGVPRDVVARAEAVLQPWRSAPAGWTRCRASCRSSPRAPHGRRAGRRNPGGLR